VARSISAQSHGNHLIDRRGDHLTQVLDGANREARARDRGIQIQFAFIRGRCFEATKGQQHVAHRLVGHLLDRPSHQSGIGERFRLGIAPRKDEPAYLGQRLQRICMRRVVRTSCEERVFVELQPLEPDATEHHRAESAVADGQRLDPLLRRLPIPQPQTIALRATRIQKRGGRASSQRQQRGRTQCCATREARHVRRVNPASGGSLILDRASMRSRAALTGGSAHPARAGDGAA
jgi:hypothetical protein